MTDTQRADGTTKHTGVRACLNRHYYNSPSGSGNSLLVGSWGKGTETRPPRDVDVLFELPWETYFRYERLPSTVNKQSELLREVRRVLGVTYTNTSIRADGQVVVVPFVSYAVEVVPGFPLSSGQYWICDTNGGGSYKTVDPKAEQRGLLVSNLLSNGDSQALVRMLKSWQAHCNVPLKSFWIELLAQDFLRAWPKAGRGEYWYDWMIRDFLRFLIGRQGGYLFAPGTMELISLGDAWLSRAQTALDRALKACEFEASDRDLDAGWEWQKIFGTQIPLFAV